MDNEGELQLSTDKLNAPTKVKSRQDITTAYVVLTPGEPIDVALFRALEIFRLVVKHCGKEDMEKLCCDGNSIVVTDFSDFIEKRNPCVLYYGPLAIKRSVASRRRLPFTGHSMLSTILYGRACCLKLSREHQKTYRLQIYALGGRLAESIANAKFLVTAVAAGKMYDIARKLGIRIVTPKLIDYLWERRNELDFELDEAHIERFRLPVFANIRMSFHGFDESTRYQLEETAILNGAVVLVSPTASSLVIVNRNFGNGEQDPVSKRNLGIEWFHRSLAEGYAKSFCRTDIECHIMGSLTDERFLVLVELRNSEAKYVETIGMIVEMVLEHLGPLDLERCDETKAKDTHSITKFQRLRIFVHFLRLYRLHRKILSSFENAVRTQEVSAILQTLEHGRDSPNGVESASEQDPPLADRIILVYKSYLEKVETLRKYVLTLESESSSFARFLRSVENRPESGRGKFADILMHPMQRWPRILLLLKRLTEVSVDSASTELDTRIDATREVYCRVQRIVEKLNEKHEGQATEDRFMKTLDILSHIEDLPPIPWNESYSLLSSRELTVRSFLNHDEPSNTPAKCFTFSHGLEIVRTKKLSPERTESQLFKHVEFVAFANVKMFFIGSVLDSNHIEICYRQVDFSQEQVLLECDSRSARDDFLTELRNLCPNAVEIHEIYDIEQRLRCESLLLRLFQNSKQTSVTKTLIRNFIGSVNKLF